MFTEPVYPFCAISLWSSVKQGNNAKQNFSSLLLFWANRFVFQRLSFTSNHGAWRQTLPFSWVGAWVYSARAGIGQCTHLRSQFQDVVSRI